MMRPLRGKLNDSQLCCLKTLGSQPDNLYFPLRQSGVGNLFDHSICRIAHFEGASPASYRQVKVKVLVSLIFCYIVLAEPKGRKLILRRLPLFVCRSTGHKHKEIFEKANYIFIGTYFPASGNPKWRTKMATQNSPAMRGGCEGSSTCCCYGRFGGNRRTCQPNPSQNAT